MEDYEKHIWDRMYLLLDGKLDVKGPEESNNDEDDDDNGGGDRDEVRGDSQCFSFGQTADPRYLGSA
jgi:hypothetical protein